MSHYFFMLILLLAIGFGACEKTTIASCPASCANDNLPHIKRVLLIGLDGCRSDALQAAHTPNLDQLLHTGRYSWFMDRGTAYLESAAVGWSTMLTGVWADKHKVQDDFYSHKNYGQYPHFLCRIKEKNACFKTASIVHYAAINEEIAAPCNVDVLLDYDEDLKVKEATQNYINDCSIDVLFAHFDNIDHAGHVRGFDSDEPHYIEAIEQVDAYLGSLLEAVYNREDKHGEDWLVIVSSNHGGLKDGTHTAEGTSVEARQVFGIFRTANPQYQGPIPNNPMLVDIVPTILKHLSIPIETTWGLEGDPIDL